MAAIITEYVLNSDGALLADVEPQVRKHDSKLLAILNYFDPHPAVRRLLEAANCSSWGQHLQVDK